MKQLDRGPLPEIYNAIFYTLKDYGEKNEYGYNKAISCVRAKVAWPAYVSDTPNNKTLEVQHSLHYEARHNICKYKHDKLTQLFI